MLFFLRKARDLVEPNVLFKHRLQVLCVFERAQRRPRKIRKNEQKWEKIAYRGNEEKCKKKKNESRVVESC